MSYFVLLIELCGTVAFAVSGAMLGVRKEMDVFGVCIMGVTASCAGGILRDLLLGQLPPSIFSHPIYAETAIAVSLLVFIPKVRRALLYRHGYETAMLVADAAGLGLFTAVGVAAAFDCGYGDSTFFAVFLGVITGVGGGVLRDVLAGTAPYIFVKHIYACASIAGALLCALLWPLMGQTAAMAVCTVAVLLIRLLAAHFRWSLPKAHMEEAVSK